MNQDKIIALIQTGRHEKAFARLYRFYPKVEKHICINSGSSEEALDIFQDALVVLHRKISAGISDKELSVEGYLITTCKLLWSNELRKKKVRAGDDSSLQSLVHEDEINQLLEKEVKMRAVENIILRLGEKCRQILEQFYFHAVSMEHIAEKFGFKTVESAKVQKYKCIETARKMALSGYKSDEKTREL